MKETGQVSLQVLHSKEEYSLKSGTPGGTVDSYANNYVFDDVSEQFNGTNDTFPLKVDGSNTTGYADDNAIVLINDIAQVPGLNNNFTLAQNSESLQHSSLVMIRFQLMILTQSTSCWWCNRLCRFF